jgi:hypothetical protein
MNRAAFVLYLPSGIHDVYRANDDSRYRQTCPGSRIGHGPRLLPWIHTKEMSGFVLDDKPEDLLIGIVSGKARRRGAYLVDATNWWALCCMPPGCLELIGN